MPENDFDAKILALMARNTGDLVGELVVDQHYALDQHENLSYEHPRGGGPHYLRNPLLMHYAVYLQWLQAGLEADSMAEAMASAMEHLSTLLDPAAPIDADPNPIRLRRSGQPFVHDNGALVYHRPPQDPREPMKPRDEDKYDADGFRSDQTY